MTNDFLSAFEEHIAAEYDGLEQRLAERGLPPEVKEERRAAARAGARDLDTGALVDQAQRKVAPFFKAAAAIFAVGSALVGAGWLVSPLETTAHAQEAHAAIDRKLEDHDRRIGAVENRLNSIDRNQLRSLNLQLMAQQRSLDEDLKNLPPGAPGRRNLEIQRDQVGEDLADVKRQLDGNVR